MRNHFSAACALLAFTGCMEATPTSEAVWEITNGDSPIIATSLAFDPPAWHPLTSQYTCFLRGISGNLPGKPIGAHVYPLNGSWHVSVDGSPSNVVKVHVGCVQVPYPGIEFAWANNVVPAQSVPALANRHCFLRSVTNATGLDGFVGPNGITNITIASVNGQFTMAGSYVHTQGSAIATCIDYPASQVWNLTLTGPAPGPLGNGTVTTAIRTAHSDAACGLTAIRGKWSNPNPSQFGSDDGVYAYQAEDIDMWKVTATNGKQATVHCLR